MSTFSLFGAQTAATTSTPLMFGTSTTTSTAPSLFGTTSTVPSIFGAAPVTTSTQAPSLFNTAPPATANAAPSIFGTTTTTAASSLFNTAPPATANAASSIFGAAPTTQQNIGLGGAQRSSFGAAGTLGGPQIQSQTNINPKDGEVPTPILSEFDTLKKSMKENNRLAEEFRIASNSKNTEILKVDDETNAIRSLLFQQKSVVQKFRYKTKALLEKVKMDLRMCEQAHQRKESMGKNPRHGHNQAIQYMHGIVDQYEKNLMESREMLAKLEKIILSILDRDETAKQITQKELVDHLERFDALFKSVTMQVYNTDSQVQDLKDVFLEQRRRISRFAPNPFEKRKDTLREQDPYASIKGIDPFPSQTALMELSEYLPKTNLPTTTMPTFGSGGTASSLFAPRPATTPFSFQSNTTAPSLFPKPFGTATTTSAPSLFSSTAPLFGSTTGAAVATSTPATTTAPSSTIPTFGSTFSSSASGTLFGGSASKPLFGK
uniref:Nucleoporin Nup58 n=1 Tax=Acrobeloides nanus TaxID=290746 RepID=A0A914CK28_9BILA